MDTDNNLPDAVVELFKSGTPESMSVSRNAGAGGSLRLSRTSSYGRIEFTRPLGIKCIEETGYAITGMRENDSYTEVWFDPLDQADMGHLTVAQRAATILDNKENDTRFEANISDDPMEQYVDVYPDPSEHASEDYSLKQDEMDRLRDEGLQIRTMSCGRERGSFNDENYRIWFEPAEE